MIVSNIETVTVLVVGLFLIPILITSYKSKIINGFNFFKLVGILNKSLIIHGIIGLVIILLSWFGTITSLKYENLIIGIAYTYLTIGIFMYLPILSILNIIILLKKNIYKKARK